MSNDLLSTYKNFVNTLASDATRDSYIFLNRLKELESQGMEISKLDTAADGLCGEAGEVKDLLKKIKFHGKPWNEENKQKLVDETGDVAWYLMLLCIGLNIDFEKIINRNMEKLLSRYPEGKFSIQKSENRNE